MAIEMTDELLDALLDWDLVGEPGGEEMPEIVRAYRDALREEREARRAQFAYREEAISGAIGADGYCYSDADPGM
jgi:hypothetical protein